MRPFILAILTLAAGSVAFGLEKTSKWVGQTVVMKYPKPLMANGHIVDNGFAYRIYTVKNAKGKQLLLAARAPFLAGSFHPLLQAGCHAERMSSTDVSTARPDRLKCA